MFCSASLILIISQELGYRHNLLVMGGVRDDVLAFATLP